MWCLTREGYNHFVNKKMALKPFVDEFYSKSTFYKKFHVIMQCYFVWIYENQIETYKKL